METWLKACVTKETSFEEALNVLNEIGIRIVLVIDESNRLLGILNDGDVRRALLQRIPFTVSVSEVMNNKPKVIRTDYTKKQALFEMERFGLIHLPVVNETGVVVDLLTLSELINTQSYDNPVFIMAGGFGTRLRPLTDNCPKPMLKIGDKPILEEIILNFINAGFHRFYISTHYLPEVIMNYFGNGSEWGVTIKYIHEDEPLGTGGALGLLPKDEIKHPLFMINGDLLTSINLHGLLDFHCSQKGIATMCVKEYEHQIPYGVVTSIGTKIESIVEKPIHKFFVNAGIYILDPQLLQYIQEGMNIDMPSLLKGQIDKGELVNMFPIHENWLDVGQMDDFEKAKKERQFSGII